MNGIENQAIVTLTPEGCEVLADLHFDFKDSRLSLKLSGSTPLTPIQALSLISLLQESFKNAWQEIHKGSSRGES